AMSPTGVVCVALLAAFGLGPPLIWLTRFSPRSGVSSSELWALYGSEFVIVAALIVPAAAGPWPFAAALIAFVWRGQFEMFRLYGLPGLGAAQIAAAALGAGLVVAGALALSLWLIVAAVLVLLALLILRRSLEDLGAGLHPAAVAVLAILL